MPGRQAQGLPQAAGIRRNHAIAPRIAPLAKVAKQPHRGVAPGIPALEKIRCIGIEHTLPAVATALTPRKRGALEIALHGAQTHADVLGHGRGCPALAVEGPDLRMPCLPMGLALGGALLRGCGGGSGWHRHGGPPIG